MWRRCIHTFMMFSALSRTPIYQGVFAMRQVALVIAVSAALAGCGADRADLSHHASARASIPSESTMPVVHRASAIAGYADHGDLVAYTRDAAIERGASTWHPVQMSEARALR